MSHPTEQFEIVLRTVPDRVPTVVRLRRFLKTALRAYRLRCVRIRRITPPQKEFF